MIYNRLQSTYSIGDEVYYVGDDNRVHKTFVTSVKIGMIDRGANYGILVQQWYSVKGKCLNDFIYVDKLFSTPEEAYKSIMTNIVDDTKL